MPVNCLRRMMKLYWSLLTGVAVREKDCVMLRSKGASATTDVKDGVSDSRVISIFFLKVNVLS